MAAILFVCLSLLTIIPTCTKLNCRFSAFIIPCKWFCLCRLHGWLDIRGLTRILDGKEEGLEVVPTSTSVTGQDGVEPEGQLRDSDPRSE